jgi:hypothetical protein
MLQSSEGTHRGPGTESMCFDRVVVREGRQLVQRAAGRLMVPGIVGLEMMDLGQGIQADRRGGMLWPPCPFSDVQRLMAYLLSLCVLPLDAVQFCQPMYARCCVRVLETRAFSPIARAR